MYIACTYAYILMHIYWLQKTPGVLGFFVCLFLPPVLVEVLYFSFFLCDDFTVLKALVLSLAISLENASLC